MSRACGDCQLCCRLLPVRSLAKGAGVRCEHQRHHKGCAVYSKLARIAPECRAWSCRWLTEDDTAELRRPDRSGYVIDMAPDFITHVNNQTGEKTHIQVVQIWCDLKRPDAWRDPSLREYMLRRGEEGIATIVRFDAQMAIIVIPPQLADDHVWHEIAPNTMAEKTHTPQQIAAALGPMHVVVEMKP